MHQTAMTKAVAGRESLRHDRTYTPHTKGKEAMSAYTLDYTYTAPSALIDGADSRALSLATSGGSTPEGAASHPYFFSGFLERADVYATALLVVARVARTRLLRAAQLPRRSPTRRRPRGHQHRRRPTLRILQRLLRSVCAPRR